MAPYGEVGAPRFRNRLLNATLTATSPNQVLRLEADGAGNLRVTVLDEASTRWLEASLEREIAATIPIALQAARRVFVQARRAASESTAGTVPIVDGKRVSAAAGEAGNRRTSVDPIWVFRRQVDRFRVSGVSRLGHITVLRGADSTFKVRIRRGVLRQLTGPVLGDEIRSAFASALASYDSQYVAAYRSSFGVDPEADWE